MSAVDPLQPQSTSLAASQTPPTLHLKNISKTFNATRALDQVSFDVMPGEVHGLLGTNGSGKSTMVKILAGFHVPDQGGHMEFNGAEVALPLKPSDFRRLGMSFVHQNLGLVPSLTVLENLRLAQIALAGGMRINWRREKAAARETLERYGVKVEQWRRIDELSVVNRALLAIVRAFEEIREECELTGKPGLVLLDEPTPFLPREDVDKLFDLVRQIADHGSSVIFISHDIEEVMEITDRVTVLRDGRVSGEIETAKASHEDMVEMIIGRKLSKSQKDRSTDADEKPVFASVRDLEAPGVARCDIDIAKGEILGLTGLIGSGYDKIPYLMFGANPALAGTMTLADGKAFDLVEMSPRQAIEADFALLPGDRHEQSGVASLSIFENMLLPDLDSYVRRGFLRTGAMRREAARLGREYEVRPNDPELSLAALSGGNAQKVLIARWMNRNPVLLLLDEPTQGVDVGTRANIFKALQKATTDGMSIVCASSDAEQLAEICDRVLVFARGQIVQEITGNAVTKDHIIGACYGTSPRGADRAPQTQAGVQDEAGS
ncbi:sugar ABC transporter ATP-binding protein [Hoeflea prorocentri]|uniref:Sugar ABC transporter ATP-binding protein n=1 Tax=Hoeflea prorocentri TaxID=1922333 RepID=A0A9X3UMR1_9HYPH|nr:sugar ABC transporter ATP-binding protein [Hoeflea prorocentri]MCY6383710.1 sugar ABC transporter ATP-binding protein [Hoeflea prorocentri]MDA5401510.1 sugar ABC transporter ATP-binding protein [Hoeflea prorocentri]